MSALHRRCIYFNHFSEVKEKTPRRGFFVDKMVNLCYNKCPEDPNLKGSTMAKDRRKLLILIVDDDEVGLRAIQRVVQHRITRTSRANDPRLSVMTQSNPERAVQVLGASHLEYGAVLAISDGEMGSPMEGPALLAALAKIFEDRLKIKLLVSSAIEQYRDEIERDQLRASPKPFDKTRLEAIIDEFLAMTKDD